MPNIFELVKALKDQAVSNSNDVQKQCHILHRGVERLIILTVREEQAAERNAACQAQSKPDFSHTYPIENPWTLRRQNLIRALAQSSVVDLNYSSRRDILISALNLVLKSGSCNVGSICPPNISERFPSSNISSSRMVELLTRDSCLTVHETHSSQQTKSHILISKILGRIADRPCCKHSRACGPTPFLSSAPKSWMETTPHHVLATALSALDLHPAQSVLNAWCELDLAAVAVAHLIADTDTGEPGGCCGGVMHCASDEEEHIERLKAVLEAQVDRPRRHRSHSTAPLRASAPARNWRIALLPP